MKEAATNDQGDRGRSWFTTTHWTVVLNARTSDSARSQQALETLCRTYWLPVYAYVRHRGHLPPDAEDLTQGFFERLLAHDFLAHVDPTKGRFRSFLLTAIKNHLNDEWDRQARLKRGGGQNVISFDQLTAEERFQLQPSDRCTPDLLFEKHWVLTILESVLVELQGEYEAAGKAKVFAGLKIVLTGGKGAAPFKQLASDLEMSEPAARMAASRLRNRYRELLRARIAQTVSRPEEIEQELRDLFASLSAS